jgi:hypothetical protein
MTSIGEFDYGELNQREMQLLTLQELQSINKKIAQLDADMTFIRKEVSQIQILTMQVTAITAELVIKSKKIEELEKFKTQITTAIIVINVIWGIAVVIINYLKP